MQYLIETRGTNGGVAKVIGHAARLNQAYELFEPDATAQTDRSHHMADAFCASIPSERPMNIRNVVGKLCCKIVQSLRRFSHLFGRKQKHMIQVLRIPVPKDRLQALSKDERVLLLLLGYVSNQILMMEKLLTFASRKDPTDDAEQKLTGVQTQMLLRLMIGVLNEAWEVVQTRFSKTRLNLEYRPLLDAEGVRSLDEINRQFGSSNLLNRIRTNYAFHQPHSDDVESAFQSAISNPHLDADWNFYFAQHAYNSMYFISDIVIVHGIFKELGESDWTAGQTKIMSEVTSAANSIKGFAAAFTKAVWQKNFGQEMQCDKVIEIRDAPKADEFSLPFFVEMPDEKPFRANPVFR